MTEPKEVNVLNEKHGKLWSIYNADCVDFASQLPDECIDFTIYSPPFANLYVYSNYAADMGNCCDDSNFIAQYKFLIREKLRVTKPGRNSCVHCMDLPTSKNMHGYIGRRDFSGDIIRAHVEAGWIFHCRVTIWKDPVVEMQRTKALGLLHKQIKKDSCRSRMGNPDYLLVFQKPGDNPEQVSHTADEFPVDQWQKWASPVWMDIDQTDVLNGRGAREQQDERHICPLQLGLIYRCLVMWSNPNDRVWSPFAGIGSEGYQAIKYGRRFIGTELKGTYFDQAARNLEMAEAEKGELFDGITEPLTVEPPIEDEPIADEGRIDFLNEIAEVCRKHQLSLAHEDRHGAFMVEPWAGKTEEWMLQARGIPNGVS